MNSKRSGAVRLPLKEPVILKSEHDPFLYGNIAKRDVIETISRKAISSLSKEVSENYKTKSLLSLPGITFKLQALNLPAPLSPGRSYHYGVPNEIPPHTKPGKYQRHLPASDRLQNRHSFLY